MRRVATLGLGAFALAACSYTPPLVTDGPLSDRPPDMNPDVPVAWTIDETSGKGVPANTQEWIDFIEANNLNMFPPDGLWSMQESSGSLIDGIGSVDLANTGFATYQQPVSGWSRKALKMTDGAGVNYANTTDTTLPNVSSSSMMILMYYANEGTPGALRSVLFGGSSIVANRGQLDIDTSNHYRFTAGGTVAMGTVDHGTDVHPFILQLDVTHSKQRVMTDRETITPTFTALGPSRGIILGAANQPDPEGRWLYMAAWYGPAAELGDTELSALLTALGW